MLAGMGVVAAAQDALDGYFITAGARVVELLMRTGGLILGVAGVLWLAVRIGAPAYLAPEAVTPPPGGADLRRRRFAAALGVVSRPARGRHRRRVSVHWDWAAYLLALTPVGGEYPIAAGLAAAVVGLLAHLDGP